MKWDENYAAGIHVNDIQVTDVLIIRYVFSI